MVNTHKYNFSYIQAGKHHSKTYLSKTPRYPKIPAFLEPNEQILPCELYGYVCIRITELKPHSEISSDPNGFVVKEFVLCAHCQKS